MTIALTKYMPCNSSTQPPVSASVINWPDFEPLEAKMQRALNLDYDDRVVMLIAIGYADPEGLIPFSEKKPLDLLRRYNDLGR